VKGWIVHCIDSLKIGGAEILLRNTISLLPEFNHTIICLQKGTGKNVEFDPAIEIIYLDYKGWQSIFRCVRVMRKLIQARKPLLVHSHLLVSTFLARLANPRSVPLISSLHSIYSKDAFEKNSKSLISEKLGNRRHAIVAVSNTVLQDYLNVIRFPGKKFVLYNFIPDAIFGYGSKTEGKKKPGIKFIALGNLKKTKNYLYLLEIFNLLKQDQIELDIYGDGEEYETLAEQICSKNLKITLKKSTTPTRELFQQYDYFIQASDHEGFGLSVIEAMAAGLPVFLSDIPVFREITNNLAVFFPLGNADNAALVIKEKMDDRDMLEHMAAEGRDYVKENYSEAKYRTCLLKIYEEVTGIKLLETCVE
jgi:glycosyltransferase involved in cell wall biosynthesis